MTTIELHGRINEAGKLEIDLPDGLPVGDVKITLEVATGQPNSASDLPDSLYGLWADLNIDISEEDLSEARREMWRNFPREDIA